MPDSVRVLLPDLTTEPPEPEIIPANVVSAVPPAVSVPAPSVIAALESLVVDVAIDATVSSKPARLNVPLLPTSNAEVLAIVFEAPSASTPADAVVAPVYELLPDNVNVPDPAFVKPLLPDIAPLKVVDELFPPAVKIFVASVPNVIEPAPAIEPTVSLRLAKSNVAPDATVTADEFEIRSSDVLMASVPSLTVVAPV